MEILGFSYALSEALLGRFGDWGANDEVEEDAGAVVEPFNDGFGEEGDNDCEYGLEEDKDAAKDEGGVVSGGDATEERDAGHGEGGWMGKTVVVRRLWPRSLRTTIICRRGDVRRLWVGDL